MPVVDYDSQDQSADEFYNIVTQADNKKWVMSASCYNAHASLVTGHAYSMLGAVKLSNGVQLVKLRNPWGREVYSGPYSDDSSDWTDALKAEAGMVAADDGTFFIPL